MKHYVYLAGPIAGCTYEGATDWRDHASKALNSAEVECLSPMRGKYFLAGRTLGQDAYDESPMTTARGINRRDFFDCTRSSCVLVNLEGAKRISIGTCMEIAWCFQARIPCIVVMEPGNPHKHMMIEDCATYIVPTLDQAMDLTKVLLNQEKL